MNRFKYVILVPMILTLILAGCSARGNTATNTDKPQTTAAPGAQNQNNAAAQAGEWDKVVAEAKKEGKVVVAGPPLGGEFTNELAQAFKDKFGITIQYLGQSSAEVDTKVAMEAEAGKASIDIILSGTNTLRTLVPKGYLDPLAPKLLLPEVKDPNQWARNKLLWRDDSQQFVLQTAEGVMTDLFVNSDIINPQDIKTWSDLKNPKYTGKIAAHDPRGPGAGQATGAYLLHTLGDSFVKDLYINQKVVLSKDHNQLASWVARGTYPIVMGINAPQLETFVKQGIKIARVFPTDAPGSLVGSQIFINLVKNRPSPNAGIVFANWIASKEGQSIVVKHNLWPSLRKDVRVPSTPEYLYPKDGLNYIDSSTPNYVFEIRPKVTEQLIQLLGK